jgi:hypothetical protein
MREVDVKCYGKGVRMVDERKGEWKISNLLYCDDTVLIGENESELRMMAEKFGDVCKRRLLKVNAGKSNVMKVGM